MSQGNSLFLELPEIGSVEDRVDSGSPGEIWDSVDLSDCVWRGDINLTVINFTDGVTKNGSALTNLECGTVIDDFDHISIDFDSVDGEAGSIGQGQVGWICEVVNHLLESLPVSRFALALDDGDRDNLKNFRKSLESESNVTWISGVEVQDCFSEEDSCWNLLVHTGLEILVLVAEGKGIPKTLGEHVQVLNSER